MRGLVRGVRETGRMSKRDEAAVSGAKEYIQGPMERFVGLKQHLMRDDENGRQKQ